MPFPSPYGDMVLKSPANIVTIGSKLKFPSPYGDMVLKFIGGIKMIEIKFVSVPLRGYGFEIFGLGIALMAKTKRFPSPCGDMVLK